MFFVLSCLGLKGESCILLFGNGILSHVAVTVDSTEVCGGELESLSAGKLPVKLSPAPHGSFEHSFGSYGMERDSCPVLVWALTKADTS